MVWYYELYEPQRGGRSSGTNVTLTYLKSYLIIECGIFYMHDPDEHALVVKAFQMACGTTGYVKGYVEWSGRWARIARKDLAELGLSLEGVRAMVIDHVRRNGSDAIIQVPETMEGHDRPYYYKVHLMVEGIIPGIFVKIRLDDETPDNPAVVLVRAHREGV